MADEDKKTAAETKTADSKSDESKKAESSVDEKSSSSNEEKVVAKGDPTQEKAGPDATSKQSSDESKASKKPEAKTITGTADVLEEKQVKKAFLSKFRKKDSKKRKEGEGEKAENELVNSSDEVAEQIYKRISESKKHEYWTINIHKKTFLVVVGVLILLLWLGFIAKTIMENRGMTLPWQSNSEEEQVVATDSGELVTVDSEGMKIRIRNITGNEEGAVALAQFLKSKGYQAVEVIEDTESEFTGVAIVVKADGETVSKELGLVLGEQYKISSPSAELTADSDFDAVILFAPDSVASGSAVVVVESSNSTATDSGVTTE